MRSLSSRAGRTVGAGALSAFALMAVSAAAAAADSSIGTVLINGKPPSSTALKMSVRLVPEQGGDRLAIDNKSTIPGNYITEVKGTLASGQQVSFAGVIPVSGTHADCRGYQSDPSSTGDDVFRCWMSPKYYLNGGTNSLKPLAFEIGYDTAYTGGLDTVDVIYNFGQIGLCATTGGARDARASAVDKCTPPSKTRITTARIAGRSASFRFAARLATKFQCELLLGDRIVYQHSCKSPKSFGSSLPAGRYTFVVWGVNRAGIDRRPALKSFTLG